MDITDWWPEQAHRTVTVQRLSVLDTFKIPGEKVSNTQEYMEQFMKHLENNIGFFNLVMHTWHKEMRSSLPLSLPTESAGH